MFVKIADILGKLNCTILMAVALGIVVVTFIIGLVMSLGGDLAKFKKVVALVSKNPSLTVCNATAKELPLRVRKQYKKFKQTGCKPDDAITPDVAVYEPYNGSVAAHFPGAVMAAGILCILFTFFAGVYVKDGFENYSVATLIVTVGVMIFRLLAGVISTAIVKGGVKAYNKYIDVLTKATGGASDAAEAHAEVKADIPFVRADEQPKPYGDTFDAPTHISVELADETTTEVVAEVEPVGQTVVVEAATESEEAMRARAREAAMAQARAEQAQRAAAQQAAMQAQAAQQAQAQAQAQAAQQAAQQAQAAQAQAAQQAQAQAQAQQAASGASSADDVIARIQKITQEGAPLATMKEVAILLQRERVKPENKTPERQRQLNEALAALLKAMSGATRK